MAEFSRYQQNVIKNYYDNRENIALQRAQELVTELYLTEGKKREKNWDRLVGHSTGHTVGRCRAGSRVRVHAG